MSAPTEKLLPASPVTGEDAAAEADIAYMAENAKSVSTYERDGGEGIPEAYDDAAPMEVCDEEAVEAETTVEEDVDAAPKSAAKGQSYAEIYALHLSAFPDVLRPYAVDPDAAALLMDDLPAGTQLAAVPHDALSAVLDALDADGIAYAADDAYPSYADAEEILFILYLTE